MLTTSSAKFKIIFDFLKKKKKTAMGTFFLLATFFLKSAYVFVSEKIEVIDKNNIIIGSHEVRIKELEQYRVSKDIAIENSVSRNSFNAYIEKNDDDYRAQQLRNDEFTMEIGNLTGRVGELESITYQLNQSAIGRG